MRKIRTVIDEKTVTLLDDEGGMYDWKLVELIEEDASWDIVNSMVQHLQSLKKEPVKPVFGDTTAIEVAAWNKGIDDLIMELEDE